MATERPGVVTVVVGIGWVIGVIQILSSVLALIDGTDAAIAAWAALATGVLTVAVVGGLLYGGKGERIAVAVALILNMAVASWALLSGVNVVSEIVAGLLAIAGTALLFSRRANEFFGAQPSFS